MSTRMLIDARHPEETRVTVVRGNRVEEFDYESAHKAQLKGNIYLAKVTRVEPSLQAAFIEYGGNRHGFLAFSEIHPDYYQIPIADREALLAEEREANARDEAEEESGKGKRKPAKKSARKPARKSARKKDEAATADDAAPEDAKSKDDADTDADAVPETITDDEKDIVGLEAPDARGTNGADDIAEDEGGDDENGDDEDGEDENSGNEGEDEMEETIRHRRSQRSLKRRYKIQEVIKRRQILLVQVVKEERGTKGAALTTYLSLAGRYCVLMPNSTHGGGVSRKISNSADRKKLKAILSAINGSQGMGCIIRTAGLQRTKAEIKRDYDYLVRLWEDIRTLTLKSVAPSLIYEEGNLIKRSIRDLYDRSIDEVLVEGEEAYKAAKALMKLLMPSHAKRVQHYDEKIPLFHRYQVEEQLDSMFNPVVTLKSGGYLVINPTEALISIDVNSGRSTREHNIEETALKTNLEASDEVGRQLRLRDMAGLVVIDYIDMEYRGNNRKIERRLKEALKADRARIQVGRISQFGLLEMSRQRLRPNLVEASTVSCRHCEGTGRARTVESSALHVLRALEEESIRGRSSRLSLSVPGEVALYILNGKRGSLLEIEEKYGLEIEVLADDRLVAPHYEMTRSGTGPDGVEVSEVLTDRPDANGRGSRRPDSDKDSSSGKTRRHRRRRGKDDGPEAAASGPAGEGETRPQAQTRGDDGDEDKPRKRRRRGRRGGRRRRAALAAGGEQAQVTETATGTEADTQVAAAPDVAGTPPSDEHKAAPETVTESAPKPAPKSAMDDGKKPSRRRRKTTGDDQAASPAAAETAAETSAKAKAEAEDKPKRGRRAAAGKAAAKKADKAEAHKADAKEDGTKASKAAARKAQKAETGKADSKTAAKAGAKAAGSPGKEPAKKPKAKSPAKDTKKAEKAASPASSGNGSPPEMAAAPAEPAKAAPAASSTGAKKEKAKRGWWQRSSQGE